MKQHETSDANSMPRAGSARLTPIDLVAGYPIGTVAGLAAPVGNRSSPHPREELERIIRKQLQRSPCVVAFSGGRDSSAILAIATHLARREGLPAPIPVTMRYSDAPSTEESDWQELVVRHLGVTNWVIERIDDEMDVLGPLAQSQMLRHGVLWPSLLHGDDYFARHAPNGSVLDGEGGDEVLAVKRHRVAPVVRLVQRVREGHLPRRWQLRAAAAAAAPAIIRLPRARRRAANLPLPWLKPPALGEVAANYARNEASEPLNGRKSVARIPGRRSNRMLAANRRYLWANQGVEFCSPFLEATFVTALTGRTGILGPMDRATTLRMICEDLLPDAILERTTKAEFSSAIHRSYTKTFAAQWSGEGLDTSLVDIDVLRQIWLGNAPSNSLAKPLLQTAWLADHAKRTT